MAVTQIVSVAVKPETIERAFRELNGVASDVRIAQTRAVNRVADKAQTRVIRGLGGELNIKQSEIRKTIRVNKATAGKPVASVVITGKRISLMAFGATGGKPKDKGVKYRIGKTGGRTFYAHAFIQKVKAGKDGVHEGVFIRKKGYGRQHGGLAARLKFKVGIGRRKTASGFVPRYPISQLFGPSVPTVYANAQGLAASVLAETMADLDARMNHEVDFLVSKRGLRA